MSVNARAWSMALRPITAVPGCRLTIRHASAIRGPWIGPTRT